MSLPELPEPDRTMWQYGKQIDHYTADQMRAYALQAVEALRREPMTDAWHEGFSSGVRFAEARHHITQKEQG